MSYGMWRKEDLGKAGSMRDILLFTVLAKPHHRTIAPTLVRGNDSLGHSLLNSSHTSSPPYGIFIFSLA